MAVIEIFDMDEEQAAAEINPAPIIRAKRSPRNKAEASAEHSPNDSEAQSTSASDAADKTAQPKRRGRPKKNPSAAADTVGSTAVDESTTQKSRRGRPRKSDEPDANSAGIGTEQTAQGEKTPSARGRGRSPNKASAENSDAESTLDSSKKSSGRRSSSEKSTDEKSSGRRSGTRSGEGRGRQSAAQTATQNDAPNDPVIAQAPQATSSEHTPGFTPTPPLAITAEPIRPQLPYVEFSPTEHALAMSLSILPAVEPPISLFNGDQPQDDAAEGDKPSKSRSRSARRRRAAARRKAEAANTRTDDVQDDDDELDAISVDDEDIIEHAAETRGNDAERQETASNFRSNSDDAVITAESDDDADDESAPLAPSEVAVEPAESGRTGRSRSRGQSRRKKGGDSRPPARAADEQAITLDEDEDDDLLFPDTPAPVRSTDRKMLVSVLPGELVEVVVLETGKVQEYYVEMEHQAKIRGNIYKGIISNIDVNLQAAFVNFGAVKNGFLQIDEVHPEYWLTHHEPTKGHKHPPIQKVMKPGQEVLVQVVKEPSGSKGAFLTTWVSLAGRFLVLTPGQEQIGISRKVEDGEERNRLRELIKGLSPGEGLGAIVRTVSAGTSKTTLQKDLSFLKRVWKDIRKRAGTEKAPSLIYKEPSLATRAVRDYLSDDVSEVWVDDAETAEAIREMTGLLFPRKADLLHVHQDTARTLWERFKVKKSLEQIHAREVILPSGGRLVFDQTEALMAIDINSGKTGGKTNFESMAQRTNVEAAEMIAHQLRLRDVGGQVVIDFIEMRDQSHVREVEKTIRNAMKLDRARYDIGKMSSFGLMQIVRQRIGSSAISISQEACPHCQGTGQRRNMEWQSLQQLRDLKVQMRNAAQTAQTEFTLNLETELALYMLNHKRDRLSAFEKEYGIQLVIKTLVG